MQQAAAFTLSRVRLETRDSAPILDGIDLDVPEGRVTALIGASGSGKSSLLRLLNRLAEPTAGQIRYRGRMLAEYPVRELRRRLGFVFQNPVLFPGTIRDNLNAAAELAGMPPTERDTAFQRVLAAAELDDELIDRAGDRLSGGERQRATIARALLLSPEALLLDEPTAALDSATADRLVATVLRMSRQHSLTVVMVTHRLDEARQVSDVVAVMDRGRIVDVGPTADVLGPLRSGPAPSGSPRGGSGS